MVRSVLRGPTAPQLATALWLTCIPLPSLDTFQDHNERSFAGDFTMSPKIVLTGSRHPWTREPFDI